MNEANETSAYGAGYEFAMAGGIATSDILMAIPPDELKEWVAGSMDGTVDHAMRIVHKAIRKLDPKRANIVAQAIVNLMINLGVEP